MKGEVNYQVFNYYCTLVEVHRLLTKYVRTTHILNNRRENIQKLLQNIGSTKSRPSNHVEAFSIGEIPYHETFEENLHQEHPKTVMNSSSQDDQYECFQTYISRNIIDPDRGTDKKDNIASVTRERSNSLMQMHTIEKDISLELEVMTEDYSCTVCNKDGMDADELKAHTICHVELNLLKQETNSLEVDLSNKAAIDDQGPTESVQTTNGHTIGNNTSNSWLEMFNTAPLAKRHFKMAKPKKTYCKPKVNDKTFNNCHSESCTLKESSSSSTNTSDEPKDECSPQHEAESYDVMIDLPPPPTEHFNEITYKPLETPLSSTVGQPFAIASLFLVEGNESEYITNNDPIDPLASEIEALTARQVPQIRKEPYNVKVISTSGPSAKKNATQSKILSQPIVKRKESHHSETSITSRSPIIAEKSPCAEASSTSQLTEVVNESQPYVIVLQLGFLVAEVEAQGDRSIQCNETKTKSPTMEVSKLVQNNDLQTEMLVVQGSIPDGEVPQIKKNNYNVTVPSTSGPLAKKNATRSKILSQPTVKRKKSHHSETSKTNRPPIIAEKSPCVEASSTSQLTEVVNELQPCDIVLQLGFVVAEVEAQGDRSIQCNETKTKSLMMEVSKPVQNDDLHTETLVVQGSILDGELRELVEYTSYALKCKRKSNPKVMPFLCGICGKGYIIKHNLKCHMDNMHAVDPVPCSVCNKMYRNEMMLNTHMMYHTREFPYKCVTCGQGFVFMSAFKKHRFKEHQIMERPFKCNLCSNAYTSNEFLRRHQKAHNSVEKMKHLCPKCGKVFFKRENLASHMMYHRPKKHLCHICGAKYHIAYALKHHMLNNHGEKNVPCESCGALFYSKLQLRRHALRYHTDVLPQKCAHCDKTFLFPKQLKHHEILVHGINKDGTEVYHCEICNQSFFYKQKMIDHINVHTGNRPYPCRECGIKFRNRHTLQQHKHTHLDIPKVSSNISCNLCDNKFKTVQTLLNHKKRHHNTSEPEPPKFTCNICDKVFGTRSILNQHNISVHVEGGGAQIRFRRSVNRPSVNRQSNTKSLVCSECNQTLPSVPRLHSHRKKVHHIDYPFGCDRCDKGYGTYAGLYQHVQVFHENKRPKPCPCPDCDAVLSSSTALKYHRMVRHSSSTEQHPCDKCGKCFKYKPHLNAHKLTHLDKKDRKTFNCKLCGKVLISLWANHIHMLIHKGIKRHACGVCGRAFTQSGDRNKHQKKCIK